jgi:hypothetical protein
VESSLKRLLLEAIDVLRLHLVLLDVQEMIKELDGQLNLDLRHSIKRKLAYDVFDKLLCYCNRDDKTRQCPILPENVHQLLIDISLEGYINEECSGTSHERKKENIHCVLKCSAAPTFSKSFIEKDISILNYPEVYECAARRKAFWSYLSGREGNPQADYESAVGYLLTIQNCCQKTYTGSKEKLKETILNNTHITNGADLYKFCYVRRINS